MAVVDTCCRPLAFDGLNPARIFPNSLYSADGLPRSVASWKSVPSPTGGYGALGISGSEIATHKDGDSALFYRRPAETSWSAWRLGSLNRFGYLLLGLEPGFGVTRTPIGEAEAPLGGAAEIVVRKRWVYLRDLFGRRHRADAQDTGWKSGSLLAAAVGMDSVRNVSSDGHFLYGENPARKRIAPLPGSSSACPGLPPKGRKPLN